MADNETPQAGDNAALRLRMSEIGVVGLREINGQILEQSRQDLRWPKANKTYQDMAEDATIASALGLFELMIGRVKWKVKSPKGSLPDTKKKAKFLEQCMSDMDHSWASFIKEVTSTFTYGFSVHEKVYRKRTVVNGSKYDDGLVGIKKLPIRSQTSILRWDFSEDGRDLTGVVQGLNLINSSAKLAVGSSEIPLPRKKFLLFRTNATRDNPEGKSPLNAVYTSWRIRKEIEQYEAIGISRNLQGMPVLFIPPAYMSPDATEEEKAVNYRRNY